MRLLLFSDLHLETHFAWAAPDVARARRQRLRDVLERIVTLATDARVDAVLCGGDLYEHDRFSPDTIEFVARAFEKLHPIPVFVAPGNHDWYGPESLYRRARFSPNVRVFRQDRLVPVELTQGLTLWGAAHLAPANTDDFLDGFSIDRAGVHLALFHGSEQGALRFERRDKRPHAPFAADQLEVAGLDHAFLGHYHRARDAERFTYPGNPDPLGFGEEDDRGVVLAEIRPDGRVARERERVALSHSHEVEVDVAGCPTLQAVRERVDEAIAGLEGAVRVTLGGELSSRVDLAWTDFETPPGLELLRVRAGSALRVAYDYEAIAREPTVRGQFVRDVRDAAELDDSERQSILVTGLRALEGRSDLGVL